MRIGQAKDRGCDDPRSNHLENIRVCDAMFNRATRFVDAAFLETARRKHAEAVNQADLLLAEAKDNHERAKRELHVHKRAAEKARNDYALWENRGKVEQLKKTINQFTAMCKPISGFTTPSCNEPKVVNGIITAEHFTPSHRVEVLTLEGKTETVYLA